MTSIIPKAALILVTLAAVLILLLFSSSVTGPTSPSTAYLTKCHYNTGLPDPNCTPGSVNPNVTQNNINSTICVAGYTATIRPSASYTDQLKMQSIADYGYNDTNISDYEEDHLISLEIGGNPTDVRNLWAEPHYGVYNSFAKDGFENYLHAWVCGGKMSLTQAQTEISTNWVQYWLAAGKPT